MATKIVTVFLALFVVLVGGVWALDHPAVVNDIEAAGDLDPTFGSSGPVMTSFGAGRHDQGYAVAVQADGKIVVAGESYNGTGYDVALARYTELGALDPDFGAGGLVLTPFPASRVTVRAVAVQADGSIVVGGNTGTVGPPGQFLLIRYTPGGALDPTFGAGGIVMTSFGSDRSNDVTAIGIQADGKIVAAGSSVLVGAGARGEFALARYLDDGALDATFGAGGLVTTSFGFFTNPGARGQALAIQPDGKLVVGGYVNLGDGLHMALARYQTNGALDPLFYGGGVYDSPGKIIGVNHGHWAYAVAVQADDRVLLGGGNRDGVFVLARFNFTGAVDLSFGPAHTGIVTTSLAPGLFADDVRSLVVQGDGKIVAAGLTHNGADFDYGLARYNADGTLDADFGTGGIVKTGIAPPSGPFVGGDYVEAVTLQPDGKLVVAGYSNDGQYVFSLARYVTGAVPTADLSLTLAASDTQPPVDSDVTFLATVHNAGPAEATGVVVLVPLPAGLVFQDAPGGGYDPDTGLWTVGTVPDGGSSSLSLVARVAGAAPASVVAEVVAADQPDPDSTPGNGVPAEDDQATVLVTPRPIADLSLALAASSLEPVAGSDVTLRVTLANDGPAEATGVAARIPLPPVGLRFVSADPPAGYDAGTGTWIPGVVPAGGSASLAIVATVISLVAVDVAAEVTATDTFDPDSTPGNGLPGEDDYAALRLVPRASGIVVNHNGSQIDPNDGFCTLREAITAANTDSVSGPVLGECAAGLGADVIQMRAVPPVHTLSAVDNDIGGANALPGIYTNITIEGNGSVIERSGIVGTPDLRLFIIGTSGSLTLKDAIVRGARSPFCAGFWNSGSLSLVRTTVSGNVATLGAGALVSGGGGICGAGSLVLTDSAITGNQAAYAGPPPGQTAAGGGLLLFAGGNATLTNSTVTGNSARSNSFAAGGGILLQTGARLTLVDSRVEANTVTESGGAGAVASRRAIGGGIFAANSASLTLTRSTVSGNSVTGGTTSGQPATGGGLYLSNVTATLTESTIQSNTAADGSGVMVMDGATVAITGGSITANVATGAGLPFGNGAGLSNGWNIFSHQRPGGTVTLDQVLVDGNRALSGGGAGVYTRGPLTLTRVTLSNNIATTKGGGLLLVDDAPVTVIASTIMRNTAREGGGLLKRDSLGGPLTLEGTTILDNRAQRGGGLELAQTAAPTSVTTLRGSTRVEQNRATVSHGGGISLFGGTLVLEDSAVSVNTATVDGGGLYLVTGNVTLRDCTVNQNHADNSSGGGIFSAGNTLTLVDSTVAGNTARIWAGLANWGGAASLTGSTVSANETTLLGGGGIGNSGTMTLVRSAVTGNKAGSGGNGGGIEQFPGATLTLDDSRVSGNTASLGGGGVALILGPSTAILRNGTIVADNVANGNGWGGGGIYGETGARLTLEQTQVRGNRATSYWGGGIYSTGNDAVLTITGSLIASNSATSWGGIGNNGSATLRDTIVSDNTATVGGGAGIGNRGTLTLVRSTVRGNTTGPDGFGGGVEQFGGGSVTLDGSTLSANTASRGGGGLGMIFGASSATLRNASVVADNEAAGAYGGGGIDADPGTTIDIDDSDIRGNRAPAGAGGGIHTQGRLTLRRSTVGTNSAYYGAGITMWNAGATLNLLNSRVHANQTSTLGGERGGGIWLVWGVVAVLRESRIEGNTSVYGGGLFVDGNNGAMIVDRVAISGNDATTRGGGLFVAAGAVVRFANSTLSGNRAAFGGGLYLSQSAPAAQVTLSYSTVAGNDAQAGGGLHATLGATLGRSIVAGNLEGGSATGAGADCLGAVVDGGSNLVGAGTGCPVVGNTTIAPADVFTLALGPLGDNGGPTPTHELLVGSPAIDASPTTCSGPPVNGLDQRSVARPRDGNGDSVAACDLGAFEL
ncbi:MAG: choice-of-anchor Q domain-containing protein [Solirubrobacterales bacterium]|jgi:uncharacterized delta-60 repeat protein/uncharacterized repeat protein (TIGR01451 family)